MLGKTVKIILIILLIIDGGVGFTVYQKYSPLTELADCGNDCIDYKKMGMAQYETSVPDIKITETDIDKLIMDVPIIIRNPSTKDTETVKIDFDVFMEGRHLTKGTIPAYELPATQNTTILIKDVILKYEELGEVLQIVASRHGGKVVTEGKANISMTTDLLIYFPIEVFSTNIYTFTIPIQIESEIPVDMLKQNEEVKKQIEEKVEGVVEGVLKKLEGALPVITSNEQESSSNIVQNSIDYDGKTVTVNGQVIISPNPGNYIIDGNSGIQLDGSVSDISEGFYKLTGVYNAGNNALTIQSSEKLEGTSASVNDALKLPNPFVAVKVQGLAASPPAFVENKLNSYITVLESLIEEIHTYVVYNNEGLYLIVSPHKSPQLNFSEATVVGTLIKAPPDKLELGKDFTPTDFKGIIIANEITKSDPIPTTVKEINQNPEKYVFKRVIIDGIYATGSGKLGYGKETVKEELRIHMGSGLMGDEFLPEDKSKLIMSIDPVYTDWQIRKGKVTGTVIYPTEEIMQYFAQKGISEVKELKPVLIVESVSEDLVSIDIEDLLTDLISNNGQKYNGKVVNITGYALGANVPVKEVAEKVARAFNPGLGEVVKMIPADVNVQGTAIADSPTPVMGQLPLAGLNSELIEKTQLMAGKYNFKVVVTLIDSKPMLFLVHKEKLPFTIPTATSTPIPTAIPTEYPIVVTSIPTATSTPIPTSAPEEGYLYVWSSPAGGTIYVDGNYLGITEGSQYLAFSATTGYHTVKISKEGYDDYSESVYVYNGQATTVDAYLVETYTPEEGSLNIWSSPAGGTLYIDGNYFGITEGSQYLAFSATTGYHTVKISKEGYDDYSESVYVYNGQATTVDAYLIETYVPTPTPSQTFLSGYPKSMYVGGDINPESTSMNYYTGGIVWDMDDRSIGLDLGIPTRVTKLLIVNSAGGTPVAWSNINPSDVSVYYSNDNIYYTKYTGFFTYTASSYEDATITGLDITAQYIKMHQSSIHDSTDSNCISYFSNGPDGSPRIN